MPSRFFFFFNNCCLSQDQYFKAARTVTSQSKYMMQTINKNYLLGCKFGIKTLKNTLQENLKQQNSKTFQRLCPWSSWGIYSASQIPSHSDTTFTVSDQSGPSGNQISRQPNFTYIKTLGTRRGTDAGAQANAGQDKGFLFKNHTLFTNSII